MQQAQYSLFLSDDRPPSTVSKRGFAEILGVSQGRVSQMITAGLPVNPNGRIDVQRGREWVDANVDRNRRRAKLEPEHSGARHFAEPTTPRGARDIAEAEISRLKAERLAGRLIDRRATLRAVEGRAKMEREGWIAWVNRAAPLIASEVAGDLALITALLDREVRAQLLTLSESPLNLK